MDPNIPIGRMTSSVGWKNGGAAAATIGGWRFPLATIVPPDPNCTTVAVTLRWVHRQPGALAAAGDRSRNAPVNGPRSFTVTWIDRLPFWQYRAERQRPVSRRHGAVEYRPGSRASSAQAVAPAVVGNGAGETMRLSNGVK